MILPHPLINPASPHYDEGKRPAILDFEDRYTVAELYAWAKITAAKYRARLGRKDDEARELAKIATFDNYAAALATLSPTMRRYGLDPEEIPAALAYESFGIEWDYRPTTDSHINLDPDTYERYVTDSIRAKKGTA